jgi:hypothetical protein
MTLFTEWQYPPGQLEFIASLYPDLPEAFASTEGQHGYQTARQIYSYLPNIFTEDPYLRDLMWAMAIELDAVRAALDEILASFFVRHAPEWGLRLWEEFSGRIVAPTGLTEEQRRSLVLSEMNTNQRTVDDFRTFVENFTGVDPSLIFLTEDFANYEVDVIVQVGLSAEQAAEFEHSFRRIVPAHLQINFAYGGFIAGVNLAGDTL